jgi:hypothetical protein
VPASTQLMQAMPPGCSDQLEAAEAPAGDPFAALPQALALTLFSQLPVDQRLRCAEVCKGWHATLNERSLWTRLDLSATAGMARPATDALLHAAAARAAGQLQALHLTDCKAITHDALLVVARANADTLMELCMESSYTPHQGDSHALVRQVEAVLGAAPRLRLLAADVYCHGDTVMHRLLRNDGVFAALRVRKLHIAAPAHDDAGVLALAADLAAHTCLVEIRMQRTALRTLAVVDAVVDAALMLQLPSLALFNCNMTPASAPALARLIGGGWLTELDVWNHYQRLLDQPAAALIADALRANNTLTSLKLQGCRFWEDAAAAALLLDALTAHRSLRTLNLHNNFFQGGDQHVPALGAALGALIAADAPALHELHLHLWSIATNEAELLALGPLVDALPLNTHLRTVNLGHVCCTDEFARDRLLPAVRANASLRHLSVQGNDFLREAAALVAARNAAAAP